LRQSRTTGKGFWLTFWREWQVITVRKTDEKVGKSVGICDMAGAGIVSEGKSTYGLCIAKYRKRAESKRAPRETITVRGLTGLRSVFVNWCLFIVELIIASVSCYI
jgi:hypothetical protein